jgi:hypothetical protein
MLNAAKTTFRCKQNPTALFTPEYQHDVESMRKHPDYDELDAKGNVVVPKAEEVVHNIPVTVATPRVKKAK